jgi:pimeloyl-ACP methyl ester carboxylesterase
VQLRRAKSLRLHARHKPAIYALQYRSSSPSRDRVCFHNSASAHAANNCLAVQYARLEREPAALADPDSRFRIVCGVCAHYKAAWPGRAQAPDATKAGEHPAQAPDVAIALLHGFGANTWSWGGVQQRIADAVGALVTAHCTPGFGLTERRRDQAAYTLCVNGDIGRALQAHELGATAKAAPTNGARTKRILVAHSLGCAGVAESFVADPTGIDGIVLVAPAIMANPFTHRVKLESRFIMCALASSKFP